MTDEERKKEHIFLEKERKRVPELFNTEPLVDSSETLKRVGIEGVFENYPLGHIKYMPQDFIVEEIAGDKTISTIDIESTIKNLEGSGKTFYGQLVKIDITTFDARQEIADILGVPIEKIATAGLKDEIAITSQNISLREIPNAEKLKELERENFFVKNIERGKGVYKRGDLWGNRFIIAVRMKDAISETEEQRIKDKIAEISKLGFWNFFYLQRFATPRLNGHLIGRNLLRGEYKEALENILFFQSNREEAYFKNIREQAKSYWGNWGVILNMMKFFPSRFTNEIKVLGYLVNYPQDFIGAFKLIPDQVRMWVYAYASFLFNKKISYLINNAKTFPAKLPFITSRFSQDWEHYKDFLMEDKISMPLSIYRVFPFLRLPSFVLSPAVPVLQRAEIHGIRFFDKIIVFIFSLPKGAYATTFLSHFFTLSSEAPVPAGIDTTNIIDVKDAFGMGTLDPVIEHFHSAIERIKSKRVSAGR